MFGYRPAAQADDRQPNPWLLGRSATDETPYTEGGLAGPSVPQHGRGRPTPDSPMPVRPVDRAPETRLLVIGTHGGAGESRIASLDRSWQATEHVLPDASGGSAAALLCCRGHIGGLRTAQATATQWAAGSVPWLRLLGLAVVADTPGRPPKPIRDLTRLVTGGVPRSWLLPWYEPWRLGDDPPPTQLPHPFRRLATQLDRLLDDDRPGAARLVETPILEGISHAHP